jgi:hypothetical protein
MTPVIAGKIGSKKLKPTPVRPRKTYVRNP